MNIRSCIAIIVLGLAATAPAARAGDVVVSAASSLTNAFKALAHQYEADHVGTRILLNFGASDVVLRQIVNGAPADVYASADQEAMNKAAAAAVIDPQTRVDFARNAVVLIVPADSRLHIDSVGDLVAADVKRVTLGNPASVPAGRYARAAIEHAGLWAALQAKTIVAQNVRQALDYVARDEVDAGFVFVTDAAIMPEKIKIVQRLASPVPVLYPMALVRRDRNKTEAAAFMAFVLSRKGQATLAEYGFQKP